MVAGLWQTCHLWQWATRSHLAHPPPGRHSRARYEAAPSTKRGRRCQARSAVSLASLESRLTSVVAFSVLREGGVLVRHGTGVNGPFTAARPVPPPREGTCWHILYSTVETKRRSPAAAPGSVGPRARTENSTATGRTNVAWPYEAYACVATRPQRTAAVGRVRACSAKVSATHMGCMRNARDASCLSCNAPWAMRLNCSVRAYAMLHTHTSASLGSASRLQGAGRRACVPKSEELELAQTAGSPRGAYDAAKGRRCTTAVTRRDPWVVVCAPAWPIRPPERPSGPFSYSIPCGSLCGGERLLLTICCC